MSYDTDPWCIYTRTHCAACDRRFVEGEGRCRFAGLHGEVFFCEPCEAKRAKPEEDYRVMVTRRREALAKRKVAIEEFNRCRSAFDTERYAAAVAAMREASREATAALAAIDGAS